jgi:hypothetical protein
VSGSVFFDVRGSRRDMEVRILILRVAGESRIVVVRVRVGLLVDFVGYKGIGAVDWVGIVVFVPLEDTGNFGLEVDIGVAATIAAGVLPMAVGVAD